MHQQVTQAGGRIDAVFFCPHAAEEQCDCRKPLPGMMLQIADRYGVNLAEVPMVCDNLRDLQAARAAGCQPHLVRTGRAAELSDEELEALLRQVPGARAHDDLASFATALLSPTSAA
jgi:D-glycero-D-manno-heptose 1,7-bisphosphate phosphatase